MCVCVRAILSMSASLLCAQGPLRSLHVTDLHTFLNRQRIFHVRRVTSTEGEHSLSRAMLNVTELGHRMDGI